MGFKKVMKLIRKYGKMDKIPGSCVERAPEEPLYLKIYENGSGSIWDANDHPIIAFDDMLDAERKMVHLIEHWED